MTALHGGETLYPEVFRTGLAGEGVLPGVGVIGVLHSVLADSLTKLGRPTMVVKRVGWPRSMAIHSPPVFPSWLFHRVPESPSVAKRASYSSAHLLEPTVGLPSAQVDPFGAGQGRDAEVVEARRVPAGAEAHHAAAVREVLDRCDLLVVNESRDSRADEPQLESMPQDERLSTRPLDRWRESLRRP